MSDVSSSAKTWGLIGAFSGFLGVAIGAFGAHGLSSRLSERALQIYHTGAQYQMYHALALIGFAAWLSKNPDTKTLSHALTGWGFTAGTVLFSGSLYALALTDIKILGAITPFGGTLFLIGWISLAITVWKS